jgi:hypothetical protein
MPTTVTPDEAQEPGEGSPELLGPDDLEGLDGNVPDAFSIPALQDRLQPTKNPPADERADDQRQRCAEREQGVSP